MRAIWLIVVGACGGSPHHAPANISSGQAPATPDAIVVEDCEAASNDQAPGSHDRYAFEDPVTGKTGYKNKAGAIVIAARFDFAYEFTPGGVAAVFESGHHPAFQFIAPDGSLIARAFAFDNGPDYFQEGLARIVDARERIGFIDSTGKIAIAPRFQHASPMCHGKSRVEDDSGSYFIDRHGQRTAPPADPPPAAIDSGA